MPPSERPRVGVHDGSARSASRNPRFALHPLVHDLLPLRPRRGQRVGVRRRPVGHRVRRRRPRRGGRAPARPVVPARRALHRRDARAPRARRHRRSARCAPRASTSRCTRTFTSSRRTCRSARPRTFAKAGRFDGYVSVGGGSVIDTCKAALLYATYPAELRTYVNAPIGDGKPVPGALPPHIACPTTCGTGSECTGIAVFDDLTLKAKTGIASRRLRPTLALIDPTCTRTLPAMVVAASGFDVLCHALESFTARPYTARPRPDKPSARPMSQGRNPWSDVGSTRGAAARRASTSCAP